MSEPTVLTVGNWSLHLPAGTPAPAPDELARLAAALRRGDAVTLPPGAWLVLRDGDPDLPPSPPPP